jgi:hypothetical protein
MPPLVSQRLFTTTIHRRTRLISQKEIISLRLLPSPKPPRHKPPRRSFPLMRHQTQPKYFFSPIMQYLVHGVPFLSIFSHLTYIKSPQLCSSFESANSDLGYWCFIGQRSERIPQRLRRWPIHVLTLSTCQSSKLKSSTTCEKS